MFTVDLSVEKTKMTSDEVSLLQKNKADKSTFDLSA